MISMFNAGLENGTGVKIIHYLFISNDFVI